MILCVHHPIGVLYPHLSKAACPAASGLAVRFIAPSRSAFGVASEGGRFSAWEYVLSFSKLHHHFYKVKPSICHTGMQLLLLLFLKRQDRCSSLFRFPLLIEIRCLPENNCCQWQLLQLKCLLIVWNAQPKLGDMYQVMNELN